MPREWGSAEFPQLHPKLDKDHFHIYEVLGMHHNWDVHNAFVFDGRHEIKAHLQKLEY